MDGLGLGDDKAGRTLLAPYRVMRVTLPASLSGLTTAKKSDQMLHSVSKVDDLHKKRRNRRNAPTNKPEEEEKK